MLSLMFLQSFSNGFESLAFQTWLKLTGEVQKHLGSLGMDKPEESQLHGAARPEGHLKQF